MAPDSPSPRVVLHRRALPSGRAVTGGFLVAFAAIGTFVAYRGAASGASHRYAVAARDIAPGTTFGAADLTTAAVDLPSGLADRSFARPDALVGRVSLAPIANGELVQAGEVADASKADPRYEVSVPLERSRALAGSVVAGELVDVVATFGTGSDARTIVVARRAHVVRVGDAKRSPVGGAGDVVLGLSMATNDEVLAVTHASQAAKVTIVRATGAAAAGTAPGPSEYRPPLTTATKGG